MDKVEDRYYYLMLLGNMLSHIAIIVPFIVVRNIFNGFGTSLILALLITIIRSFFSISVCNTYKDLTIIEINRILFGKVLGNFFSFVQIMLPLSIGFLAFRGLVEIAHEHMLPKTPSWFLSALLLLLLFPSLSHSKKSQLNFIGFISIVLLLSSIFLFLVPYREIRFNFIKVVWSHSIDIPSLESIAAFSFFFSSASQLYTFNPCFKKINYINTFLVFILVGVPLSLLSVLIPIGTWGPWALQQVHFIWTSTADTAIIDISPIERGLFLLLPIIFLIATFNIINSVFMSIELTKTLIPNKKVNHFIIAFYILIYFIVSVYIKNTHTYFIINTYIVVIWFIFTVVMSVPLYILSKIKGEI